MKHVDPLDLELQRLASLSRHWDDAADALQRKDYAGFDAAMTKFRQSSSERGGWSTASRQIRMNARDYEAWRPALIAFYRANGPWFQTIENLERGCPLSTEDKRTVDGLREALKLAA